MEKNGNYRGPIFMTKNEKRLYCFFEKPEIWNDSIYGMCDLSNYME